MSLAPFVTVQQGTHLDVAQASAILQEAATWLIERDMPLWVPEDLTPQWLQPYVEAGELYLALVNDFPAGTMLFQWEDQKFWPDIPAGESAFFHKLAIRRQYAGSGVSKAMIRWAARTACSAGKRYLRLDCAPRPRLCAFYESLGFQFHSQRQVGPFLVNRYEQCLMDGSNA